MCCCACAQMRPLTNAETALLIELFADLPLRVAVQLRLDLPACAMLPLRLFRLLSISLASSQCDATAEKRRMLVLRTISVTLVAEDDNTK